MSKQLCLKWNNHKTAFHNSLSQIFLEDLYSDGTILCQGTLYPVHRFVLSTCSEYFKDVFQQSVGLNNKHPFIIINDIQSKHMEALLNYMYKGEVNVPQDMLPELIKTAEAFKIKGLALHDDEPPPITYRKRSRHNSDSSSPIASHKKNCRSQFSSSRKENIQKTNSSQSNFTIAGTTKDSETKFDNKSPSVTSQEEVHIIETLLPEVKVEALSDFQEHLTDNNPIGNSILLKTEQSICSVDDSNFLSLESSNECFNAGQFAVPSTSRDDTSQVFQGESTNNKEDSNRTYNAIIYQEEFFGECPPIGGWSLKDCHFQGCSYSAQNASDLRKHFRIHTGEKPFKCTECPYRASQKSSLNRHAYNIHAKSKSFNCCQCSFTTTVKAILKEHVLSAHFTAVSSNSQRQSVL